MKIFLRLLLGSLAVVLCQCSDQQAASKEPGSTSGSGKGERVLHLYSWEDYMNPMVIETFTERSGIDVRYHTFEETDEVESALRAEPGKYDVVVIDNDKVDRLRELRMLRKVDKSLLPNFKNLAEKHLDQDYDPGNEFSVPYLWGTTLLAYRNDKIPNPEPSWNLLWESRLKGRIGMLNERNESIGVALFRHGRSMNERSEEALALAEMSLMEQVERLDVQFIAGVPAELEEGLTSGDIWAGMAYSGDAVMVAEEHENVSYFIPKEGCAIWMDHLVIARDSQNVEEAHEFLNFLLEGEIAAENANYLHYASPNVAAEPYLAKEMLDNPGIVPPAEILERCEMADRLTPERERPVNRLWGRVMSAWEDANLSSQAVTEAPQSALP